jgi:type IV pilus assembly protein PilY1
MKMNKKSQIVTFKLSVLSTWLLCLTANSYASDIEIYRGPNPSDGKASIMLNLDNSTFMTNEPSGNQSKGSIYEDFGADMDCGTGGGKYMTETVNTSGYNFTGNYCTILQSKISTSGNNQSAILADCTPTTVRSGSADVAAYKCYDRFTRLKISLLSVINDASLGDNISLGLSYFPPHTATPTDASMSVIRPLPLTAANRVTLSNAVAGIRISDTNKGEKQVNVSQGYGKSARALLTQSDNTTMITAAECTGYGIYNLTSGIPVDDDMGSARTNTNVVLQSSNQILNNTSQCPDGGSGNSASDGTAWQCIGTAAQLLANSKSKLEIPVKTAVVSFGSGFSFSPDLSGYISEKAAKEQSTPGNQIVATTATKIKQEIQKVFTQNNSNMYLSKQNAAIAGVFGGGGYYAAYNINEVKASIIKFAGEVTEVDIPYITTGAPTIPQDPLNAAIVQNYAYYSQFKPTPDKAHQLWAGNLKKYKVNANGQLIDKEDTLVVDGLGMLVDNFDLWSPTYDAKVLGDENTPGSLNFALMGGAKSKLSLRTSVNTSGVTVVNRKLLTNRNSSGTGESTALNKIDLSYLSSSDADRGYLISLLGYKVDAANPSTITTTSLAAAPELRQLGAVMHSSPLLFSNKGKIDYDEDTGQLETTNREDYVLYATTQGLLHVVKAGESDDDSDGGKEIFAFVPHEMVTKQKQAFLNADQTSGGLANFFYGIDAPWTAYTEYVIDDNENLTVGAGKNADEGKQLLFGGLRMGGKSYYSLNLQNVNDPKLNFHIDPENQKIYYNNTSKTVSQLSYMGQSWSKPKIAWVRWGGQRKLVMFVGGGYDSGYEADNYNQTNQQGSGVYMFDALNGDLLWWASANVGTSSPTSTTTGVIGLADPNLKYSVVSDIKTADRNNDGLVDHLYFGDLGGQVFRIDLDNTASTIGAFAKHSVRLLNIHQTNGTSPRFFEAPAFSTYKDSASGKIFAVISIGTGNRSLPLKTYPTGTAGRDYDALYNIYDKDVTRADLYGLATTSLSTQDLALSGSNSLTVLNEITDSNRFSDTSLIAPYGTSAGWYYKFKAGTALQTEKILNTPAVIDYDLYVSSYDSSKQGFSGKCGGGVQGESKVTLFCMPFGQCVGSRGLTDSNSVMELGSGIRDFAIGATDNGLTRLITGQTSTDTGSVIPDERYSTKVKLIPQRWYEK